MSKAFPTVAAHVPPVVVTLHGFIVGPARADMVCGGGTTITRLDAPHVSSWLRDMIDDQATPRDPPRRPAPPADAGSNRLWLARSRPLKIGRRRRSRRRACPGRRMCS